MAHEIDTSTGAAAVFVTGKPAWHKLGTVVAQAQTSAEAIRLARLDWEVLQQPLYTAKGDGGLQTVVERVANVRADTHSVLGVVSPGYRVFQNRDAFDFMDTLVGERLAMFETAGALRGGRRVWMLARVPKELRVTGKDVVHPYVLLANSHDGSMALRMIPTTVRVVCQNTLNLALNRSGAADGLTIRHCESLEGRVHEARTKLGVLVQRLNQFEDEARSLAACRISDHEARDYFEEFFPVHQPAPRPATVSLESMLAATQDEQDLMAELLAGHREQEERTQKRNARILEQMLDNFHSPAHAAVGVEGTAWAAYNAVSEYADHQSTVRGRTEAERADHRLHSVWFGTAHELKQRAYAAALELVGGPRTAA